MARRMKCYLNIADGVGLAIRSGLARRREVLAVANGHRLDRLGRRQHGAMPCAGVVRMPVRDDRAINPAAHRVDIEITRRAKQPLWRRAEKVFGADHAANM